MAGGEEFPLQPKEAAVQVPEGALEIVRRLKEAGHEAFLAGGCVRDRLMGREPGDWDVATGAEAGEVQALFARTVPVGAQFGVVRVLLDDEVYEVARFRRDDAYEDGRRPVEVHPAEAREDALRRDFTINGMFYDPLADRVIDYVGGEADIRAEIVRAIGDPVTRFGEDHLRMLRAVRFAARFGFELRLACPELLSPPEAVVAWARDSGATIVQTLHPEEAVSNADCVVTDTWVSMGDESGDHRHNLLRPYRVDDRLMSFAKSEAIFMHCLPAHREEEVTASVMDGPKSAVWDEAENRLHAQKGILSWCMS